MNTYWFVYIDDDGNEVEMSASYSDAFRCAEDIHSSGMRFGKWPVIKEGWR